MVHINRRFNTHHEHDIRLGDGTCELQSPADLERMSGKNQGAQALQDIPEPIKIFASTLSSSEGRGASYDCE